MLMNCTTYIAYTTHNTDVTNRLFVKFNKTFTGGRAMFYFVPKPAWVGTTALLISSTEYWLKGRDSQRRHKRLKILRLTTGNTFPMLRRISFGHAFRNNSVSTIFALL